MKPLERRLQKLEVNMSSKTDPSAIVADFTWDEMNAYLLVLEHQFVQECSSDTPVAEIEAAEAKIAEIESKIRHWALKRMEPDYQRHIERIESGWRRNPSAQ